MPSSNTSLVPPNDTALPVSRRLTSSLPRFKTASDAQYQSLLDATPDLSAHHSPPITDEWELLSFLLPEKPSRWTEAELYASLTANQFLTETLAEVITPKRFWSGFRNEHWHYQAPPHLCGGTD